MKIILKNKKASFNYFILDKYESGIELKGVEVKSIYNKKLSLDESYVTISKGEVWIVNMHISPYEQGNRYNQDPLRKRKLLLHKKEILKISTKIKKEGLTLIPTMIYWSGKKIKVEIGLAKGKKLHDKRDSLKKKETKKEMTF
ncbi:MAG: SsrA-binding protein SmpB [Mycoplasmoidaceae bacterium]